MFSVGFSGQQDEMCSVQIYHRCKIIKNLIRPLAALRNRHALQSGFIWFDFSPQRKQPVLRGHNKHVAGTQLFGVLKC